MRTPPLAFVGHESLVRALRDILRSTSFGHAMSLIGPDTTAAAHVASWVSRVSLCEQGQDAPCEQCSTCISTRHQHSDRLIVLSPGASSYAVDDVRELRRKLQLRGQRRIVIVHRADLLRGAAANALLKTIEEPLGDVHFLLLTAHRGNLLPTLRSRTMVFYLQRVAASVARAALLERGYASRAVDSALRAFPGMPAAAASFLDDPAAVDLANRFDDAAKHWLNTSLTERLRSAAGVFAERADADIQRQQLKACIAAAARTWPPQRHTHLALCTASRAVQTNAQPRFILDALLAHV